MESIGLVTKIKTLFTTSNNYQRNDYKLVPRKKSSYEESESDYDPIDDKTNQMEESDDNLDEEDGILMKGNIPPRSHVKVLTLVNFVSSNDMKASSAS
ncbi:hypothetical protein GUJ93_ZPchr0002g24959 [Zizania palustris]|uniref:Uncharacterized protein n=1 Tax=Zizania palustris TaxID=103762 RepID=A0A8J5RZD6_ZIZPA|nr:hypothetical protein GUJ93_ZPchr0002g24959 [Zizania palustris]